MSASHLNVLQNSLVFRERGSAVTCSRAPCTALPWRELRRRHIRTGALRHFTPAPYTLLRHEAVLGKRAWRASLSFAPGL